MEGRLSFCFSHFLKGFIMAKMYVSAERFCEEWMKAAKNGEGAAVVASRLGIKESSCHSRAKGLRDNGVQLPKLVRASSTRVNYEALKLMIEKSKEEETELKAEDMPETEQAVA